MKYKLILLLTVLAFVSLAMLGTRHLYSASSPPEGTAHKVPDWPQLSVRMEVPPDAIVADPENPTLRELGVFAWNEFFALTWPALDGRRGMPDPNATYGETETPVVWETYWHKVEMFPGDQLPNQLNGKPNRAGKPLYKYIRREKSGDEHEFVFKNNYVGPAGLQDSTLFHNLDEASELDDDDLYVHQIAQDNAVLYEAKMNYDGYKYILEKKLYLESEREKAKFQTLGKLSEIGSSCKAPEDCKDYICLPCGELTTGKEGNIEIKAAFRRLTSEDDPADFFVKKVIRYIYVRDSTEEGQYFDRKKYTVSEYALIGLHIIHKTQQFPSFTYATFEHVNNEKTNYQYFDLIDLPPKKGGEVRGEGDDRLKVHNLSRDIPVPKEIKQINEEVHRLPEMQNVVWKNYQLINIQAVPIDYSSLDPSDKVASANYHLANLVIESNEELQNFRGSRFNPSVKNTYTKDREFVNMGGCMGCHGRAQSFKGTDFNFLIGNAPFSEPEIPRLNVITPVFPIRSYRDVREMFKAFESRYLKIGVEKNSPKAKEEWRCYDDPDNFRGGECTDKGLIITHKRDRHGKIKFGHETVELKYSLLENQMGKPIFIRLLSGDGDRIRTTIDIQYQGKTVQVYQVPREGIYFQPDQIKNLEKWIKDGCPNLP